MVNKAKNAESGLIGWASKPRRIEMSFQSDQRRDLFDRNVNQKYPSQKFILKAKANWSRFSFSHVVNFHVSRNY